MDTSDGRPGAPDAGAPGAEATEAEARAARRARRAARAQAARAAAAGPAPGAGGAQGGAPPNAEGPAPGPDAAAEKAALAERRARRRARRLAAEAAGGIAEGGARAAPAEGLPAAAGAASADGNGGPADGAAPAKGGGKAALRAEARARRRRKQRPGRNRALRGRPGGGGAVAAKRRAAMARGRAGEDGAEAPRPAIILDMTRTDADARARRRSLRNRALLWLSFIVMVAAPSGLASWYLYARAADQYASQVSFAVRSLEGSLPSPVMDLFGGAADSTAGDSQMLFEYLQSQPLATKIDADVDLREIYNRPEGDPFFSLGRDRTVEELVTYWNRAVGVSYDSTAGIIYVEVRAFRPDDAQTVAEAVLAESERLINGLSTGARADSVRFAEIDLARAEDRVRDARLALQAFRSSQGTADIAGDISQEMALIAQLRAQRSGLQSDYDSRKDLLGEDSPTLSALRRRLASLDAQIAEAEARIAEAPAAAAGEGAAAPARATLSEAAGRQEALQVELEFATSMYTSAEAALEAARAEARRAQRYLATHIEPTLSQEAAYPRRAMWSAAIFAVLLTVWAVLLLILSSIRDRN